MNFLKGIAALGIAALLTFGAPVTTQAQESKVCNHTDTKTTLLKNAEEARKVGLYVAYTTADRSEIVAIHKAMERFYGEKLGTNPNSTAPLDEHNIPLGDGLIVWKYENEAGGVVYLDIVDPNCLIATMSLDVNAWNAISSNIGIVELGPAVGAALFKKEYQQNVSIGGSDNILVGREYSPLGGCGPRQKLVDKLRDTLGETLKRRGSFWSQNPQTGMWGPGGILEVFTNEDNMTFTMASTLVINGKIITCVSAAGEGWHAASEEPVVVE